MVRIIEAHSNVTLLTQKRCSAGNMKFFRGATRRKPLSRHSFSVMNFDTLEEIEDTVDKKNIEFATKILEEDSLMLVFKASVLNVDGTVIKIAVSQRESIETW